MSPAVHASTQFTVSAKDQESATSQAILSIKEGSVSGWSVLGRILGGNWAGTPGKIWVSPSPQIPESGELPIWNVSALSVEANPTAIVEGIESPSKELALEVGIEVGMTGGVQWYWMGLPLGGSPPPDVSGWATKVKRATVTDLTPPAEIVPNVLVNIAATASPSNPPGVVSDGILIILARTGPSDTSPVVIGFSNISSGTTVVGATLPLGWAFSTAELSSVYLGNLNDWLPSQGPWHEVPVPVQKWIWTTSNGSLYAIKQADLSVTEIAPPTVSGFQSVTSLYLPSPSPPGIERIDTSIVRTTEAPTPDLIPTFDPVSLNESDFIPGTTYDEQFYIRFHGSFLWKTRNGVYNGYMQKLDPSDGSILNEVDLNAVPFQSTEKRTPYAFTVVGDSIHVFVNDNGVSYGFVEVDMIGNATVRQSTGNNMFSSSNTMSMGGQIAVCGGALWIGDAMEVAPPPPSFLYSTDLSTYVTSSITLSDSIGSWTGGIASDGSKIYASFLDSGGNASVARIATDGTVEAVWLDVTSSKIGSIGVNGGFLWVVVRVSGLFSSDFDLVQLNPSTLVEVGRTTLYVSISLLGLASTDITFSDHGPGPPPPPAAPHIVTDLYDFIITDGGDRLIPTLSTDPVRLVSDILDFIITDSGDRFIPLKRTPEMADVRIVDLPAQAGPPAPTDIIPMHSIVGLETRKIKMSDILLTLTQANQAGITANINDSVLTSGAVATSVVDHTSWILDQGSALALETDFVIATQSGFGRWINVTKQTFGSIGPGNTAGPTAFAVGTSNTVSGTDSMTVGTSNLVSGVGSFASGNLNNVSGTKTFVSGQSNIVTGDFSFAMGNGNTLSSNYATAAGNANTMTAVYGGTWGNGNTVTGDYGFVFGQTNTLASNYSFVNGKNNYAGSEGSFSFGNNAYASKPWTITAANGVSQGSVATQGSAQTSFGFVMSGGIPGLVTGESVILSYNAGTQTDFALEPDKAYILEYKLVAREAGVGLLTPGYFVAIGHAVAFSNSDLSSISISQVGLMTIDSSDANTLTCNLQFITVHAVGFNVTFSGPDGTAPVPAAMKMDACLSISWTEITSN